jgi:hypothetical protein
MCPAHLVLGYGGVSSDTTSRWHGSAHSTVYYCSWASDDRIAPVICRSFGSLAPPLFPSLPDVASRLARRSLPEFQTMGRSREFRRLGEVWRSSPFPALSAFF